MRLFSRRIGPLRLILLTATIGVMAYQTYKSWPKPPSPPTAHALTPAERADMASLVTPTMGTGLDIDPLEARKRERAREPGGVTLNPAARRAYDRMLADPVHNPPRALATGAVPPASDRAVGNMVGPAE